MSRVPSNMFHTPTEICWKKMYHKLEVLLLRFPYYLFSPEWWHNHPHGCWHRCTFLRGQGNSIRASQQLGHIFLFVLEKNSCSLLSQIKSKFPVSLERGFLIFPKFLTYSCVNLTAPKDFLTSVVVLGTGQLLIISHLSGLLVKTPPALCSTPGTTVLVTNSSSFLKDSLGWAHTSLGNNWFSGMA